MNEEALRAFARYNRWMNTRLYELAASLSDADRKRDLHAFFKSLHGTLEHIYLADRIWLSRFRDEPATSLTPNSILDFEELRKKRAETDAQIIEWTDGLTPPHLAANFAYRNLRGDAFEHPLWYAVIHFFNHQTHHRGQATTLLMQLGKDPGVTDIIGLLRDGDWMSV